MCLKDSLLFAGRYFLVLYYILFLIFCLHLTSVYLIKTPLFDQIINITKIVQT